VNRCAHSAVSSLALGIVGLMLSNQNSPFPLVLVAAAILRSLFSMPLWVARWSGSTME
jgi:hypothetical protein